MGNKTRSAARKPIGTIKARPFRLGFLIHDVSRLRRGVVDRALKPLGVTRSQWWVLANLSRHDGVSMMQTELAQVLDVGKVALGGLLDRLEASGFIMRKADPIDRRVKRIQMTAAGNALLSTIQKRAEMVNDEMLRGTDEQVVHAAEDFLHDLKLRLIEMHGEDKDFADDSSDD